MKVLLMDDMQTNRQRFSRKSCVVNFCLKATSSRQLIQVRSS